MRTVKRIYFPLLLILLGVFACALPGIPQVDQNAAGTAVASTLQAIIQQTKDAGQGTFDVSSETPVPTSTPSLTFTPIPVAFTPTITPTGTLPPTLVFTPTPIVPMIRVSVATNCRLGPGKTYTLVGALLVGETAQVYARSSAGDYWYIRNPDRPTQFCWLWGEYATVSGLYSGLPIYTPPPSPTPTYTATPAPGFDASYQGLQACSGKWWGDIKLKNTGSATFRSVNMTLRDTVTSKTATTIRDGFTDLTGCSSTSKSTLAPGKSVTASSPQFAYNPAGHKLKLTITLCTSTGLNGLCVTETITFKP